MRTIALVIALLSGCTSWRTRDSALDSIAVTVTLTDWLQSEGITKRCQEANPIIGECGQRVPPNIYFPLVIVTEMVVARLLPPDWRPVFQAAWIGAESATVIENIVEEE